jgi:hypothetical protein
MHPFRACGRQRAQPIESWCDGIQVYGLYMNKADDPAFFFVRILGNYRCLSLATHGIQVQHTRRQTNGCTAWWGASSCELMFVDTLLWRFSPYIGHHRTLTRRWGNLPPQVFQRVSMTMSLVPYQCYRRSKIPRRPQPEWGLGSSWILFKSGDGRHSLVLSLLDRFPSFQRHGETPTRYANLRTRDMALMKFLLSRYVHMLFFGGIFFPYQAPV